MLYDVITHEMYVTLVMLQTLSSSLDGPLSPQYPTDVTSMSSRLYYDSVQLNHVTQQHADVLRYDVIAEPIKHFNAECKYLLFAHFVLQLMSVLASFITA